MNAEAMTFPDDSFDLVFGSGIIHHLDIDRAFGEIARVLRPGGRAVFIEPLGLNPAIELYLRFTPSARTPDEPPPPRTDFTRSPPPFGPTSCRVYGLANLASWPFRRTIENAALFAATLPAERAPPAPGAG